MTYQLNDAPNRLQAIFVAKDLAAAEIDDIPLTAVYPQEVDIRFDCDLSYFYHSLQNCYLANDFPNQETSSTILFWQVRQVYRIVNSLLASNHPSITFKNELIALQQELEQSEQLKSFLNDIQRGTLKPDIICSGEGAWIEGAGNVSFPSPQSKYCSTPH